ncbi:MAG: pyruvate kinase [Simkania sp.]|nr:pyruvate kinase [Simkania sp.]MCP5490163.1 pyruvate kinase [Chlamydiales bacterium]
MAMARTKIICTMGPAVSDYNKILELIDAGMNVARLNMSHGNHEQHREMIRMLKNARAEKGVPLAIMLDTKGPEIRVGKIKGDAIALNKKQTLKIMRGEIEGSDEGISFLPPTIVDDIPLHATVLFDDGYINSHVIEKTKKGIVVEIQNNGVLRSQKGVNIPHAALNLPAVTQQDIQDIIFGCEEEVDLLAASFIRNADHILEIKKLLTQHQKTPILVIAKIENALGVKNFDSILQAADGIMVARGDLGVELPITQVPKLQKMMIRKCYQSFKPVITATQMLESMIENLRPTRAEVSDVANAIYDSTSAVMLSGETAIGKYPVETVRLMRSTILATEKDFKYEEFFYNDVARRVFNDISSSVALAAVKTAYAGNGKALIALTTSGFTARVMARFRPKMPIIAITPKERTYHQLAFVWGITPVHASVENVKQGMAKASCFALQHKILHYGDLIVVTSGSPFGVSGTTNMMLVDNIGDVLVRGMIGEGRKVHGKVKVILSFDPEATYKIKDRLVVIPHCHEKYKHFLKGAAGIILQNHPDDCHSEQMGRLIAHDLKIPILLRADAACTILKDDQMVTLDPNKGLVFEGIVESEDEMLTQVCKIPH